jgi:hypothetical protein
MKKLRLFLAFLFITTLRAQVEGGYPAGHYDKREVYLTLRQGVAWFAATFLMIRTPGSGAS